MLGPPVCRKRCVKRGRQRNKAAKNAKETEADHVGVVDSENLGNSFVPSQHAGAINMRWAAPCSTLSQRCQGNCAQHVNVQLTDEVKVGTAIDIAPEHAGVCELSAKGRAPNNRSPGSQNDESAVREGTQPSYAESSPHHVHVPLSKCSQVDCCAWAPQAVHRVSFASSWRHCCASRTAHAASEYWVAWSQ